MTPPLPPMPFETRKSAWPWGATLPVGRKTRLAAETISSTTARNEMSSTGSGGAGAVEIGRRVDGIAFGLVAADPADGVEGRACLGAKSGFLSLCVGNHQYCHGARETEGDSPVLDVLAEGHRLVHQVEALTEAAGHARKRNDVVCEIRLPPRVPARVKGVSRQAARDERAATHHSATCSRFTPSLVNHSHSASPHFGKNSASMSWLSIESRKSGCQARTASIGARSCCRGLMTSDVRKSEPSCGRTCLRRSVSQSDFAKACEAAKFLQHTFKEERTRNSRLSRRPSPSGRLPSAATTT